jgi:hypothetical protein
MMAIGSGVAIVCADSVASNSEREGLLKALGRTHEVNKEERIHEVHKEGRIHPLNPVHPSLPYII